MASNNGRLTIGAPCLISGVARTALSRGMRPGGHLVTLPLHIDAAVGSPGRHPGQVKMVA
jgi:hypothetical protein